MAIFSLIIGSLGAAGFTGAVTIFGLSPGLSAALISVGKSVLWSAVAKATEQRPPAEQVQAVISQSAGPRIRGYGEQLLGGTRALWEPENGMLHQIVVFHHGEVSQIVRFEVDGEAVTLDGAGNVTSGSTAGYLAVRSILSGDGGDYPEVQAAFPTLWTAADHRLAGQATYYTRMRAPKLSKFSKVFPRQDQTAVAVVARLAKVLDPRSGMVAYSDLTGPCAMDYLTHEDGYRIPLASIDQGSFGRFTDLCDEDVPLRAGGTEKRWRIGGVYSLDNAPKDVMARILATADAQLYMTAEGKVGICGGAWSEPDVTIGASDILSLSLTDGFDEFTDFNVLKGKFTSPDHRFQETECAELVDLVALETQPQRVEEITIDMCPSQSQMQRLMKAYRTRQLPRFTGTIRTNLVGMKARFPKGVGRHVVRIDDPESEFSGVFEVLSHSFSIEERVCVMAIASLEDGYAWVPSVDEGDPPPALEDLERADTAIAAPTGLTVSQQVVSITGGVNAVRLVLQVADPGREGLQLQAEYRLTAGVDWLPMVAGVGDLRALSPVVDDGQGYTLRARWEGEDTWSAEVTITALSNPVAPASPASLGDSVAAGVVTLNWINPVDGFYRTRIYRGASAVFGAASLIGTVTGVAGQAANTQNTPGVGTWYYWAVTINASALESAPSGPRTVTI